VSVTRLLVLGVVRIFQPSHGYLVRRELASWQAAEWAQLNPGSVYNALRALTKDNLLVEEPDKTPSSGSRTRYRLTVDGEQEFQRLVREALWQLHPYEPAWLLAGMSFWWVLSRDEVLAALRARAALLEARVSESTYMSAGMPDSAAGTPSHVVEHFRIAEAQLRGELEWVQAVSGRIQDGAYGFSGEDPRRMMPAANPMRPPGEPGWPAGSDADPASQV
jgi:DNA-binding PadR family transcriptional regulator